MKASITPSISSRNTPPSIPFSSTATPTAATSAKRQPPRPDHRAPCPRPAPVPQPSPGSWVKQHDEYFKNTSLRHPKIDASNEYANRDIFVETLAPARNAGMKVFARILEAGPRGIENWNKIVTIDVNGRPTTFAPCWNHPEYRAFWNATVEDLFKSYDLDGFQWGAERSGPLCNTILNGRDPPPPASADFAKPAANRWASMPSAPAKASPKSPPTCVPFRMAARGGKPARRRPRRLPPRISSTIPTRSEYQYRLSLLEVFSKGIDDTIKKIKPAAPSGWHVDHWAVCMDPTASAQMPYADQAPYSDFLKIVVYHACTGPRTHTYLSNLHLPTFSAISPSTNSSTSTTTSLTTKPKNPPPTRPVPGLPPRYVFRETKHSVASSQGKVQNLSRASASTSPPPPPIIPKPSINASSKGPPSCASGFVASRDR